MSKNLHVNVLSLERRQDRWLALQDHVGGFNGEIVLERFLGEDGRTKNIIDNPRDNGGFYCTLGHLFNIQRFSDSKEEYILFAEDDFYITDLAKIKNCLQDFVQSEADALNLGFNPLWMPRIQPLSTHLETIQGPCLCMHLYALKPRAIPRLARALRFCLSALLQGATVFTHCGDWAWSFPQFQICVSIPRGVRTIQDMPVRQTGSESDISIKK
jgi:hypothetical protein